MILVISVNFARHDVGHRGGRDDRVAKRQTVVNNLAMLMIKVIILMIIMVMIMIIIWY